MALDRVFGGSRAAVATGIHGRKVSQLGGLRSMAVGFLSGKMAPWPPRKRHFPPSFRPILGYFLGVFSARFPKMAPMRANAGPEVLVLNDRLVAQEPIRKIIVRLGRRDLMKSV
jgi:hypothetical protein